MQKNFLGVSLYGLIEPRLPTGPRGFTLIEVLVSISVLSLVLLLLTSSLFGVGQLERIVKGGADRREISWAVSNLFRTTLGTLFSNGTVAKKPDIDKSNTIFKVHGLEWTGYLHGREGVGGLYRMKVAIEDISKEKGGIVYFSMITSQRDDFLKRANADPHSWTRRLILSEVSKFDIEIEASKDSVQVLSDFAFIENPSGIKRITIKVALQSGEWPDIVLVPKVFGINGDGVFSVGGEAAK